MEKPAIWETWETIDQAAQIAIVCEAVAEQAGCEAAALRGPPRVGLAKPRKLAVFLCHALIDIQHGELGRAFNMSRVAALKATHDAHWRQWLGWCEGLDAVVGGRREFR